MLRPSRARLVVVVFAIALAIVQYIDRVAISQAAPAISQDLSLSKEQMGWVFGAFTERRHECLGFTYVRCGIMLRTHARKHTPRGA